MASDPGDCETGLCAACPSADPVVRPDVALPDVARPQAAATRLGAMDLSALGSRGFRIYLVANFVSIVGIWINRVTIGWLGWSLTGSTAWVGALSFLLYAPTLFAGPFFGALADRIDVRRGAVATQAVLALLTLALGCVSIAGLTTIWVLAGIAVLFGATASANGPIRLTLVPQLVAPAAIANAITLISINFNAARLVGPAVGGLLIGRFGAGPSSLASLALMLPMLVTLPLLVVRDKAPAMSRHGVAAELVEAFWRILGKRELRQAMAITAVTSIVAGGALEVLPAVVDGVFGRGAAGLGQTLSAAGAGALCCGLSMIFARGAFSSAARLRAACLWTVPGTAIVFAFGMISAWPLAICLCFGLGAFGTFSSVTTQAVVQLDAGDAFRGRAIGFWLLVSVGGTALGALLYGMAADATSIRIALGAFGMLGFVVSLVIWGWVFGGREP